MKTHAVTKDSDRDTDVVDAAAAGFERADSTPVLKKSCEQNAITHGMSLQHRVLQRSRS